MVVESKALIGILGALAMIYFHQISPREGKPLPQITDTMVLSSARRDRPEEKLLWVVFFTYP